MAMEFARTAGCSFEAVLMTPAMTLWPSRGTSARPFCVFRDWNRFMPFRFDAREHLLLGRELLRALLLALPVAVATGSACALFLWALEAATEFRFTHPWLLYLLPLGGVLVAWLYETWGKNAAGGNNLIMDAIHSAQAEDADSDSALVPRRMAPLILATTVITHLFGGSAGREGTAVQMGGSLASGWARVLRVEAAEHRTLLMCGIAAGFGGVFGTPIAGAVFAMEVLAAGRVQYDALIPCLFAALVGDYTTQSWGTHHTHYAVPSLAMLVGVVQPLLAAKVALAAVAFGLAATLFAEMTHGIGDFFKQRVHQPLLRPVIGGALLIALTALLGTRDYLGLGVSSPDPGAVTIVSAFHPGGAEPFSWWWKLLFTALTLGGGFKGGEVTPLFFVGAALGHSLASPLGVPVDLLAALGFIGVFSGATNTPLACTLMGVELFGGEIAPYAAIACFVAYACSGHSGIYLSQRIGTAKGEVLNVPASTLRQARESRAGLAGLWRKKGP
jgi:H+/Cl- antiporter ClcA